MPSGAKRNKEKQSRGNGDFDAGAIGDRVDIEGHAVHILMDEIQVKEMRALTSFSLQSIMEIIVAMLVTVQVKHQVGYSKLTSVATLTYRQF